MNRRSGRPWVFEIRFDPPASGDIGVAFEYKTTHPFRVFFSQTSFRMNLAEVEKVRRELAIAQDHHGEWLTRPMPLIAWTALALSDPRFQRDGWVARLHHVGNGVYHICRRNHRQIVFRIGTGVWTEAKSWIAAVEVCEAHAKIEQQKLSAAGGSPVPEQRLGASETPPLVARDHGGFNGGGAPGGAPRFQLGHFPVHPEGFEPPTLGSEDHY
jgi:hypothetical protein